MIRHFPREHTIVERTRLRFINLPNVLNDGKGDRSSRVPGYAVLFLGGETEVIFLLDGEPAAAARWTPGGRAVLPVTAVLDRAERESERADFAYHGAPHTQLLAMLATVAAPPTLGTGDVDAAHPGRLFAQLRERGFSGVIEAKEDDAVHYLLFDDGTPTGAFLAHREPGESLHTGVDNLFTPTRAPGLEISGYPPVDAFPVQAPAALVQLYDQTLHDAFSATRSALGPDAARCCFSDALDRARAQHPVLGSYEVNGDGVVQGEPVAPPDALTDAVAAWLFEALTTAERDGAVDPAELLEQVTRDSRYALEAQGFFGRLPWPVG